MDIDEKFVRETEIKTVSYLLSVLMGIIIPNIIAMFYLFFNMLDKYLHNDNNIEIPDSVSLKDLFVFGFVCIVFLAVLLLALRKFIGKVRTSEKKLQITLISSAIIIVLVFGLGYFSVNLFALIYNIFYLRYFI